MKFTKKQKEKVTKHLYEISEMDKHELRNFAQKWHLAKQDLDDNVFKIVLKAIDVQMGNLISDETIGIDVVMSEIGVDEDE